MHTEILTEQQKGLLSLISEFKKEYILVGGTAIALYLGHRRSIDFDLFSNKRIKRKQIKNIIINKGFPVDNVIYEAFDQMHLIVNGVKLTFFEFPHKINAVKTFDNIIKIPDLLTLGAMKTYALGGRAKWKDYVDLFYILKYHHSFEEITKKAKDIFGNFFNIKLFREQLSYFDDIDYSEPVTYLSDKPPSDEDIRQFLIEISLIEF